MYRKQITGGVIRPEDRGNIADADAREVSIQNDTISPLSDEQLGEVLSNFAFSISGMVPKGGKITISCGDETLREIKDVSE